ncbi:hypothetical protein [Salinibacillus xinjiangensis]|uniref:Uncharacterized protein n=1 Tax=Salinibacillus xinjiangensis TaxID=1229268 RepID=A0A6G1X7F2_9BACI|nr:hypothetical protein [Salinibacillus xinjiangensis]MRG86894.1 hypothetical protein [Salinibacillus xinjiangensis]
MLKFLWRMLKISLFAKDWGADAKDGCVLAKESNVNAKLSLEKAKP